MGITRIKITNYRGIETLEADVPPAGAIIVGDNGQGKTTVVKAIQAALTAQDIGADAIRLGADKAEILVDLNNVAVRRAITRKTSSLIVTNGDGFKASAPQTFLRELLGTSDLDPIALFTLKPKERRAKILEALPVTVTVEQLRQWVPKIPDSFDVSGHGVEVVERVHKKVYEQRTAANAAAKAAKAEADASQKTYEGVAAIGPDELPDVAAAEKVYHETGKAYSALIARADEHKRSLARTEASRAKIEELNTKAFELCKSSDPIPNELIEKQQSIVDALATEADALQTKYLAKKEELRAARDLLEEFEDRTEAALEAFQEAEKLTTQARELESAISQASVAPVSDEELAEAQEVASFAAVAMDAAKADALRFAKTQEAKAVAEAATKKLLAAELEAKRLDGIVKALADAPSQLISQCEGIPGLTIDGDNILLDGVSIDSLCGAEKIRLAVEIARRANAKSKILVVDELERLSAKNLLVFIREATRDGWQLIGTRVTDGGVVVEAIDSVDQAAE